MYRVFNMGIGMAIMAPPYFANSIIHQLERLNQPAYVIGKVRAGSQKVKFG